MLVLFIYVIYLSTTNTGLVNGNHVVDLQITTADQCVDESYRMVHNRNFTLYCYFNHSASDLTIMFFKRGSETIVSHPGVITVNFDERATFALSDNVATIDITANLLDNNNTDYSNYTCSVGVQTLSQVLSEEIDPTTNSVTDVSETEIINLITGADNATISSQPFSISVAGTIGTGDYDCMAPSVTVEDEDGSVCNSSSTESDCKFVVDGLSDGSVQVYTVTATMYGVSVSKVFSITYIEPLSVPPDGPVPFECKPYPAFFWVALILTILLWISCTIPLAISTDGCWTLKVKAVVVILLAICSVLLPFAATITYIVWYVQCKTVETLIYWVVCAIITVVSIAVLVIVIRQLQREAKAKTVLVPMTGPHQTVIAVKNETIILVCKPNIENAVDQVMYRWMYCDNNGVEEVITEKAVLNGNDIIRTVNEKTVGVYFCKVETTKTISRKKKKEKTVTETLASVHVNVQMENEIVVEPSGQDMVVVTSEGEDLKIRCSPNQGKPSSVTYSWHHIDNGNKTVIIENENTDTLMLKKLTEADMGNYICEVTDSDGKTQESAKVDLQVINSKQQSKVDNQSTDNDNRAGSSATSDRSLASATKVNVAQINV